MAGILRHCFVSGAEWPGRKLFIANCVTSCLSMVGAPVTSSAAPLFQALPAAQLWLYQGANSLVEAAGEGGSSMSMCALHFSVVGKEGEAVVCHFGVFTDLDMTITGRDNITL